MIDSEDKEKIAYEANLQRRLKILRQFFEKGRIKLAKGLKVIESLKAVRYAPDGSVDLNTVDGLVRAMALGIEATHEREELKKGIPLAEIQTTYFRFLDNNFGDFYKIMVERGLTPHQAGLAASRNNGAIEEITKPIPDFLRTIEEFWAASADAAYAHVEDMDGTFKGVFGGDLFPSQNQNIVSKCGLYTDTLILPDPFIRTKFLFELGNAKENAYYLLKHALSLLQYRDLACADLTPPIIVILPDLSLIDKSKQEFFRTLGNDDALIHSGKVFGRTFGSIAELNEYAGTLNTLDSVVSKIADRGRVLFDAELKGDLRVQITKASQGKYAKIIGTTHPGLIVASLPLGRMNVIN